MKTIYTIQIGKPGEITPGSIIGVASTTEMANELIHQYYEDYIQVHYDDVRDSGIEFVKTIEVFESNGASYLVKITVLSFTLDEL